MKKATAILRLILILALLLTACAPKSDFSYSDGITDAGHWKGVKALKYVELCEYEGISVPNDVHTVSDDMVQMQIDSILYGFSSPEQVTDRPIEDGDTVNIDYVGSIDGVEFQGGSTGGQGTDVTIGVTPYIDDFLEQLIGHTPGESFDIEVTFPEDFGVEDLNGKDAVFAITINYIVETITPDLTDEFVAENFSEQYGYTTVAGMKDDIRNDLKRAAVSEYVQNFVMDNSQVKSLPNRMVKYQENMLIKYYQEGAESYSMEMEEFLSTYLELDSVDALLEEYREDIVQKVSLHLVMQAVAEDAGITVTDEDVAAYFQEYTGSEDYSQYLETYGMPYIKVMVLRQAVLDYLCENAVMA